MNTHALLDQHPSVQALSIGTTNRVNDTKAAHHTRVINARPFTTASAVLAAHKGGRKDAKCTRIEVTRNEANINAAAVAAANQSGKFSVSATTKLAAKRGLPQQQPPAAAASSPALPPVTKPVVVPVARLTKPNSTVSSAPSSFDATSSHADSYSDYDCSCCHPRKAASSVVSYSTAAVNSRRSTAPTAVSATHSVPLSAYDNMTSISERIARQKKDRKAGEEKSRVSAAPSGLTGSMTSSKLRDLESQLEVERRQRMHTEEELAQIKARQELLLSKLSPEEREEVRRIAAEQAAASRRVTTKSEASGASRR